MPRILIVDNHSLSRIGLESLLSRDPSNEILGAFRSFPDVKPLLPSLQPHLIIVDLSVSEACGYNVIQFIKRWNHSVKVVIVTFQKDEIQVMNALQDDVDGYIHKTAEPEEIVLALSRIAAGQKYFSAEISNIIVNNAYRRQARGVPFLTTKEKEIIRLLMEGHSSKQIAAKLDVSPRTIHSHRANILSKFNVNNTTQLVTRIAEQKIVI